MQVLAIFSLFLAVATSYPVVKTWTLTELSEAITNPRTDTAMMPYLEEALNEIMLALFTGENENLVKAVVPSPTGAATWTVAELKKAIADPNLKHDYKNSLMRAYGFVKSQNHTGNLQAKVEVSVPALDISTWTQADLVKALKSNSTKPELIPYLEKAEIDLKIAADEGEKKEIISMVTPVGLIPPKAETFKPIKRFFKKTLKGS